ncbi:carbonic anhydrase 12 isoform X1 [Anguilla anguilla]|uniref:carbonic anhydrase 12 isoform X1 n=1 Tax=Anguilla anguilla TaxID=7936 RepID=UPI0015ACDD7C|nr:carbonic anhydrase 12 isoform X1 [Anguilla anguilla]
MHFLYLQASTIVQVWTFMTVSISLGHKWTYTGPDGEEHWHEHYPFCHGTFQSPIDLNSELLRYDPTLVPIEVWNYNLSSYEQLTLGNNGHSVQLSLPRRMHLSGLPHRYSAAQLHLHWGSPTMPAGSEHTVNGKQFTAELHVVHFNSDRYPNVSVAADKSDGLAVLGILIEVGDYNPSFGQFLKYLDGVKYKDQRIQVPAFDIRGLLPAHMDEYYRYDGSLTTPPCYPSVLWTVFRNPITISEEQFLALCTSVFSSSQQESAPVPLNGNYRKSQDSEDRIILVSFREGRGLHGTLTVAPAFLRRQVIQRLMADQDDDEPSRLLAKTGHEPGADKKWTDRMSQRSLGPSTVKQKRQQSVRPVDRASFGPSHWKNPRPTGRVRKPGLFKDRLCYSSLEKKVHRQLKDSRAEHQLIEALREVLFPELNVRSYLACRSELALPTVRFLLQGQPMDKAAEQDIYAALASYGSPKISSLHPLHQTHANQKGHHQAMAQKNTENQARPNPMFLGWELED